MSYAHTRTQLNEDSNPGAGRSVLRTAGRRVAGRAGACLLSFAGAVFVAAAAVVATWASAAPLGGVRYFIPLALVAVFALIAGTGPALVNTLLTVIGVYWIVEPRWQFVVKDTRELYAALSFALVGVLLAVIGGVQRRARKELVSIAADAVRQAAARHASERQYRALAEHSPEIIARFDRQLRHAYINAYGALVYGVSAEQVVGKTNAELGMPADKVTFWKERFEEVFATGKQQTVDFEYAGPTFGYQCFSSLFVPETDEHGKISSVLAITRDVTELRRTERALREERDFVSAVLQTTASVVAVFNRDGRMVRCNRACEVLSGYTADELQQMRYSDLIPEDELAGVNQVWDQLTMGDFPNQYQNHWRRKDGALRLLDWANSALADEAGRIKFVVATGIDVTDRVHAEDEVRHAAEVLDLGDAYLEVDRDYRILRVNGEHERISQTSRSDSVGRILWDVWPEAAHPDSKFWREYHRVMQERVPVQFEEYFAPLDLWSSVNAYPTSTGGFAVFIRDVGKQKRAEQALRRSEEQRRLALAAAELGTWDFELHTGEIFWDERSKAIFAVDAHHMAYPDWLSSLVHPADRAYVSGALERLLDPNNADRDPYIDVEYRITLPDGSVRWVHTKGEAFFEPSGTARKPVRFIGTVADISARKHDEEVLRAALTQAEDRGRVLDAMLDNIPIGIAIADAPNVASRFVSRYGRELLGKTTEELTGVGAEELPAAWRLFRSDGKTLASVGDHPLARAIVNGETVLGEEWVILREDGIPIPILCTAAPIRDQDGKVIGGVVGWQDITERKTAEMAIRASEAKFRSVFEQAAIGMARVRFDDARWTDVNDAFCRMLGYSREEMLHASWPQMTFPADMNLDLIPFNRMAEGQLEHYTVEKRFVHKQGHHVWARLTLSLVRDHEGRPDYEIAIIEDIGDRKRAEEALREADRRKNEFLAMLSHELRNPLAPIKNSLYILERATPGGQQAKRAHDVIGRQVMHMTRLIDDLLDVTRISRGKIRLQRERVELCDLVRRTAEDHRSLFIANEIELEFATCKSPMYTNADATRLAQIVGNLLSNAAKFTNRGGRVVLSLTSDEYGVAEIRVRDNGAGIPPELVKKLFEPFVQADSTLDRSKGGLGLGLALVKGLSELHGGSVSVRSAGVGKGAEFIVRIPLETGVQPEASATVRTADRRTDVALRVLVIEDNLDAAESLKEALEMGGHQVEIAVTGIEGIEKARQFRPDVVLCDIGLPGIDGFEVARRMRSDPQLRDAPLVALSGYAGPDDLERSREAGFMQHLAKPPDLGTLENTLSEAAAFGRASTA